MIDSSLIIDIDRSWLYFLKEALQDSDFPYVHQSRQERFSDGTEFDQGKDFFILHPIFSWTPSFDEGADSLRADVRVGVVCSQKPGDVLVAHTQAFAMQQLIEQALFGPERLLVGQSMGDTRLYSIPLRSFNENGEPLELIASDGIQYERATWNDISREEELTRIWALDISVLVTP
jgi:hypothetical protein